jgi:hypothetical protein
MPRYSTGPTITAGGRASSPFARTRAPVPAEQFQTDATGCAPAVMNLLRVARGPTTDRPERAARSLQVAQWDLWARADSTNRANRNEAVRRIKAFSSEDLSIDCRSRVLNLSGLSLSSLPRNLPASLRMLDLGENEFAQVPENLPASLTHLNLSKNRLTSLSRTLPPELLNLKLSHNRLSSLPDELPPSMLVLYAENNELTHLPESLPRSLGRLNVSSNNLVQLPSCLPDTLTTLEATKNRLTALPDRLPSRLWRIDVTRNRLRILPAELPVLLEQLIARQNQLIELPQNLPGRLLFLDAEHNQLQRLPHQVVDTSRPGCAINLGGNPLEQSEIERVQKAVASDTYSGPRFDFSLEFRSFDENDTWARPLAVSVVQWLRSPQTEIAKWLGFQAEDGADAFSDFIDRLSQTVNFKNQSFR